MVYRAPLPLHAQEISREAGLDLEQTEIAVLARVGEIDQDSLMDACWFGADNQDLLGKEDGFANAVSHEENGLPGLYPNANHFLAELARVDFVKSGEWFI